jgi:hypothetical protein
MAAGLAMHGSAIRLQARRSALAPLRTVRARDRACYRRFMAGTKRSVPARKRTRKAAKGDVQGSLIGRRVGRSKDDLDDVLAKGKAREPEYDTARPGVSATSKKAGGRSTARRNVMKRAPRATATLEDSRTTPSRKSTRRSANRQKSATPKQHSVQVASRSPKTRATRARAARGSR